MILGYKEQSFRMALHQLFKQIYSNILKNSQKFNMGNIIILLSLFKQLHFPYFENSTIIKYRKQRMHQISFQQLAKNIPKLICDWNSDDICLWLSLNQIQIQTEKIKLNHLNGWAIRSLSPNDWMNQYGASRYISRQIVQWLQDQADQFQSVVNQLLGIKQQAQQNQSNLSEAEKLKSSISLELEGGLPQDITKKAISNQEFINIEADVNSQFVLAKRVKSHQQIIQIKQSSCEQIKNKACSQQDINRLCQYIGQTKSSSSLQSQQQVDMSQQIYLQKERIYSDITDRHQKIRDKNKNNFMLQKQSQKIENQSIELVKLTKKNKEDLSKNIIDKNNRKNKNKYSVFQQPKIYNYINGQPNAQKNKDSKIMAKRPFTSQQICPAKVVSPNNKINSKVAREKIGVSPNPSRVFASPIQYQLLSQNVKFTSSQFVPYNPQGLAKSSLFYEKKIKISSKNYQEVVSGFAKIGRFKNNQVNLSDETVSRYHAQIIPMVQMNGLSRFYLKDIGSKFGTFVQCRGIQSNIQGKSYLIGDAQVQILSVEITKQHNLQVCIPVNSKKPTFDIKIRIDRQKELTILNRSVLTIGKRQEVEHRIQGSCDNARLLLNSDKSICLEAIQGKLYEKLKQHQFWDIQGHLDKNNEVQIIFGWLKTTFQLKQMCTICNNQRGICVCQHQLANQKK